MGVGGMVAKGALRVQKPPCHALSLSGSLGSQQTCLQGVRPTGPVTSGASVCMTVQWEWEILQDDIGSSSRWREKMSMEGTGRRSPTAMLAPSIPLPQDARASL